MRAVKTLAAALYSSLLHRAAFPYSLAGPSPIRSVLQSGEGDKMVSFGIKARSLSTIAETALEYEMDQPYDDGKVTKKDEALNFALSQLALDFDQDSKLSLHRFHTTRFAPVISTGSLRLDQALGIGGLPKGRMVEIYGREASGKTTLALHIVKEAQKLGGYCAYIDAENALHTSLAEAMGVDTENLLVAHPNSAENSLSIVNTLVNSGSVDVVVVDSVAALIPQYELDSSIDMNYPEVQSRLMKQALRKIHSSLSRSQTLLVFVNQVRINPKVNQGIGRVKEITCGGNALKFYSAVRMRITRCGLLHNEDEINGITVSVEIIKNKLAPAMKKATIDIGFGRGICHEEEVLEMAAMHGIVLREGNCYWIKGKLCRDQQEACWYLVENREVTIELVNIIRNQLFNTTS